MHGSSMSVNKVLILAEFEVGVNNGNHDLATPEERTHITNVVNVEQSYKLRRCQSH